MNCPSFSYVNAVVGVIFLHTKTHLAPSPWLKMGPGFGKELGLFKCYVFPLGRETAPWELCVWETKITVIFLLDLSKYWYSIFLELIAHSNHSALWPISYFWKAISFWCTSFPCVYVKQSMGLSAVRIRMKSNKLLPKIGNYFTPWSFILLQM